MRIAVLSDIHGNIAALDAVLEDILARNVDQIVNLGDICSGPLFPCETADRLMALDLPTIKGNHERQILTQPFDSMGASDQFARTRLQDDQIEWLSGLPDTLSLPNGVLLVHGTPGNDLRYFLHTVTEEGVREATTSEIEDRAAGGQADVIFCGHTHLPRAVAIFARCLVVNPGSVGLPAYEDDHPFPHAVETGSPHARYAIANLQYGFWSAELRMVKYDWEAAAQTAEANGRADWARALRTGLS